MEVLEQCKYIPCHVETTLIILKTGAVVPFCADITTKERHPQISHCSLSVCDGIYTIQGNNHVHGLRSHELMIMH